MVFSSVIFLVYFLPILLVVYYFSPNKWKNVVLLLSSIFFYAWGAPRFIFVILLTTVVDFVLVNKMESSRNERLRKIFLSVSVIINVGLLVYFKYMNFFVENLNYAFTLIGWDSSLPWISVMLPIGISFYTFETLTYVIDVYRRVHKPLKNFWDYQLYIILFPKLIAGPIIRYHELAEQIHGRFATDSNDARLKGFYRFVMGLAKKVFIANTLAAYVDTVYGDCITGTGALNPETLHAATAWAAALAYTFQIYFDFSGYSDMAIGLGLMLGFRFPENFTNPYTAESITAFWRKWHMTLGNWMRNYLYIPLGGNQVSARRLYFNLWIVFILSGLWHGASWGFIFWGAYHGFFLVIERAFNLRDASRWTKIPRVLFTFIVVVIGWVFFRVPEISTAAHYVAAMFRWHGEIQTPSLHVLSMLVLGSFFSFFVLLPGGSRIQDFVYGRHHLSAGSHAGFLTLALIVFFECLGVISASTFNPFIYFRF